MLTVNLMTPPSTLTRLHHRTARLIDRLQSRAQRMLGALSKEIQPYADRQYEHACGGLNDYALCCKLPTWNDCTWHTWTQVTCPECKRLKGTEDWK